MAIVFCAYYAFSLPRLLSYSSTSIISHSMNINSNLFSLTNKPKAKFKSFNNTCCHCKHSQEPEFSVLEPNIPWECGDVWSSFAFYLLSFHVPLSFGGLSVLSRFIEPNPQIKAVSFLVIQMVELASVYWVLTNVAKPKYDPFSLFQVKGKARNWVLGTALGFGFIVLLVLVTSLIAAQNEPVEQASRQAVVEEILSSGAVSQTSCILAYCIVTPLLEEILYRGILLTSLATEMEWYKAVFISSVVFSAAHFSGESFLQLFVIGSVLGCSYCWTGSLRSPFLIHSLYNALILLIVSQS